MEEDIIDQLYFGRIVPWERQVEKTPEIEKYSDQVCEDIEYLQKRLDEVGKSVLERLLDNNSEVERLTFPLPRISRHWCWSFLQGRKKRNTLFCLSSGCRRKHWNCAAAGIMSSMMYGSGRGTS